MKRLSLVVLLTLAAFLTGSLVLLQPQQVAATPAGAGTVLATIAVNANPQDVAVSPDGRLAYVSTLEGNTVDIIDLETMKLVRSIAAPAAGTVATTDDGAAFVATNEPGNTITAFAAVTGKPLRTIAVGTYPVAVVAIPGTHDVLTADNSSGTVTLVDIDSGTAKHYPVGATPWGIGMSRDGSTAYVVLQSVNSVAVFDLRSLKVTRTIPVGARPAYVAASSDGRSLYVAEADGGGISKVDLASGTIVKHFAMSGRPWGVAIAWDGDYLYAADNADDYLMSVDSNRGTLLSRVPVGSRPDFVATTPDGSLVLVVNSDSNTITIVKGYSDPPPYSVDSRGVRTDAYGYLVDADGHRVDANGNRIDAGGNTVDAEGNTVDVGGNTVDANGNRIDAYGNPTAEGASGSDPRWYWYWYAPGYAVPDSAAPLVATLRAPYRVLALTVAVAVLAFLIALAIWIVRGWRAGGPAAGMLVPTIATSLAVALIASLTSAGLWSATGGLQATGGTVSIADAPSSPSVDPGSGPISAPVAQGNPLPALPLACTDVFSESAASALIFSPVSLKVDQVTVGSVYEAAGLQTGLFHCIWGGKNKTDSSWDQSIDLDILPNAAAAFDAGVWQVDDGAIVYPAGSATSEYLCPYVYADYAQCFANVLVDGYWAHARVSTGDIEVSLTQGGMEASMRSIVDSITAAIAAAGAPRAAWVVPDDILTGAICGGEPIVGESSGPVPADGVAAQRSAAVSCDYSSAVRIGILPGGGWAVISVAENGQSPTWSVSKLEQTTIAGADLALWGCGDGCYSMLSIGNSAVSISDGDKYEGPDFLAELPGIVAAIAAAG